MPCSQLTFLHAITHWKNVILVLVREKLKERTTGTRLIAARCFPLSFLHAIARSKNSRTREIKGISKKSIFVELVQYKMTNFRLSDLYQYKQL